MRARSRLASACGLLLLAGCRTPEPVDWVFDDLVDVGGLRVELLGKPQLIETKQGRAVLFDGVDDGLLLYRHPLAGARELTVEVVFRPDPQGPAEQRFLHLQEDGSKDRILLETRMTDDGGWFLDTYVKSDGEGHTLYARDFVHPTGRWYHVALVVGGSRMRHYVDGVEEMSRSIEFSAQRAGSSSVGVRINRVSWFKGGIARARFTPRALSPAEFDLPAVQAPR